MLIGMHELPRLDLLTEDLHFTAPSYGPNPCVTDTQATTDRLEAGVRQLRHVAHRAIRDCADTAQGAVNVRVDLTPKRANGSWLIQILHNDDLGSRLARHV